MSRMRYVMSAAAILLLMSGCKLNYADEPGQDRSCSFFGTCPPAENNLCSFYGNCQ